MMTSWPSRWIANFLKKPENAFMCVVDEQFIRDGFNLFGLDEVVPYFATALRIVLQDGTENVNCAYRKSKGPELVYGMVHARFVMTDSGIQKMLDKYNAGSFGHCPRVNCKRPANFLPIGLHDEAGKSTVKLYCPQCMEVYFPPKMAIESSVDGAYFGTGFPEMVFMTRPECRPSWPKIQHVSKIYGFKIHSSAIESQRFAAINNLTSAGTANVDNGIRQSTSLIRQPTSVIRRKTANNTHTTARRLTTIATGRQTSTNVTSVKSVRNLKTNIDKSPLP